MEASSRPISIIAGPKKTLGRRALAMLARRGTTLDACLPPSMLALRARGVPVGLGTDSMLSNNAQNLFQEMKFAVLLQRAHRLDGHALSARDALAMATREGAQVLGWQSEIGSLEPGKEADLVILDMEHPLGLTPERVLSDLVFTAGPQHIHAVMVHGDIIFEQGRFTRIDEKQIRDQIQRHGQALSKNSP